MRCPFCGADDTKVLDSRPKDDGYSIRRRRMCDACGKRFTTYEKVESSRTYVIKRDGRREPFLVDKVMNGIRLCCQKLPVSTDQIAEIANRVERQACAGGEEVSTETIGDLVMSELYSLNFVAYVRFAAVYKNYDLEQFTTELEKLRKGSTPGRGESTETRD